MVADVAQAQNAPHLRSRISFLRNPARGSHLVWRDRDHHLAWNTGYFQSLAIECGILDPADCCGNLLFGRQFWVHLGDTSEMVETGGRCPRVVDWVLVDCWICGLLVRLPFRASVMFH